jgi:hypothetical protein
MKRLILLAGLFMSLSACGHSLPPRPKLPYPAWYVGLAAPRHMEVWVETVDVLDRRGLGFSHVFGGVASYTGKVKGWHKGAGASMPINNVDLPMRLLLRWQSLAEPQTYQIEILIPQWVRDGMLEKERFFCTVTKKWDAEFRNIITLGMAPGGIVKVWLGGPCLGFKEVGRFQAEINPLGPHSNGNHIYYRAPNPKAQAYIDQHGIPYGSW